jgi:C1A family cysteine protease
MKSQQGELDTLLFKKYQKFLVLYEKNYSSLEEINRKFPVFKQNYLKAKLENSNVEQSGKTILGVTEFMDMTSEEFESNYLKLDHTDLPNDTEIYFNNTDTKSNLRFLEDIPEEWDWTTKGAVNPIRNQGFCGGCWAFSAISNIESANFIKNGILTSFSEQQLVDCDFYNSGCAGGIMHKTFLYIKQYGLVNSTEYPYNFKQGKCKYNSSEATSIIKSWTSPGTDDEEKIKEMLYKVGPLSITINARILQYYKGGVLNVSYDKCPYAPSHGVNLVGYGVTSTGLKYWKVRNTWGTRWGENGYFRIARGKSLCGLNKYVITAVLA